MGADRGVIYGLHAGDGAIRYVGLTRVGITARLARHRRNALAGSEFPVHRWMRKHGVESVMAVEIEACSTHILSERERYWIAEFRSNGARLLNATDGGEGVRDSSGAIGAKISAAKKGKSPSVKWTVPHRAEQSPESRARAAQGNRRTWAMRRAALAPGESFFGITECPQGHAYTPENSGYGPGSNGYPIRYCKACRAAYKARKRREAREQKVRFE